MPILLAEDGYEFRFFSNDRSEPPHVHVRGNGGRAKIWLAPSVKLGPAHAYTAQRRGEILRKAEAHRDEWLARWSRHFGTGR